MSATEPGTAPPDDTRLSPQLIKLAVVVMLGALAIQLDGTVISVAIEALKREFNASLAELQWVGTGYLLALALVIPLAGWSAQRVGARRMWLISLTMFLVGSLMCGLSWSLWSLVVFRLLQGFGGGLIMPLGQAILIQEAGVARRGKLMSVFAVPAILGPVLGPVVGGVFVTDISWRWIFFINVPICLIALWLSWRVVPDTDFGKRSKLDVLGLSLLSPGLVALVYALSQAGNNGNFSDKKVVIPLILGVLLVLGYAWHALRPKVAPIIDIRLFRFRSFTSATLVLFFFSTVAFGAALLLPLFFQEVRGMTAFEAGIRIIPFGVGTTVALMVAGKLTDSLPARWIVAVSLVCAVAGFGILTQIEPDTNGLLLALAMVLIGLGAGAVQVSVTTAAFVGLNKETIPRASSAVRIMTQLGSSAGAATLFVVLQRELNKLIAGGPVTQHGLAHTFQVVFWWTVAFAGIALVVSLFLPSTAFKQSPDAEPAEAAPAAAEH
ncbi:MDR family MFS transporter [Dactylosporangium sp. NPDC051541]|uniref:MDR family MFS transporter n=1 Tax=Dactylosporangium sp. NPDC051541 TaxID=3363977 RepID=UPI0037B3E3FF